VATRLTVGVVSDTHGLVRPEAIDALRGSDVILHAGDIGGSHVLQELGAIAPVIPVRGNVDGGWARLLPERRILDLGGVAVLILHDRALVGLDPFLAEAGAACAAGLRLASATKRSRAARPRSLSGVTPALRGIVVFGHSHQPLAEKRKGVLWFNPGSAGPRRFELPVSVGRLVIEDGRVRHRLLML
jgi:predicted phosphodiesterase